MRRGHLVTVTSLEENTDCVTPILQAVGKASWIAASDAAVEGEWRWVAGPETGVQFWQGGPPASGGMPVGGEYSSWDTSPAFEPNGGTGENFVAERTNGNWNDTTGTSSFGCTVCGYIVEYDGNLPDIDLRLNEDGVFLASVPNGTLITVEESTARARLIGSIGINSFSDLALSNDGRLFGSLGRGQSGAIVEIDPWTGEALILGFSGFDAVPAIDFGPPGTPVAGRLFGIGLSGNDSFLIEIDTVTGAGIANVGPIVDLPLADGIVFDDDGRLFALGFFRSIGSVLGEIDMATGEGRVIGPIGFWSVVSLELASDGSLIGTLGGADFQSGGLLRIDPHNGAGTFVGFTGFTPVSGLASARVGATPQVCGE